MTHDFKAALDRLNEVSGDAPYETAANVIFDHHTTIRAALELAINSQWQPIEICPRQIEFLFYSPEGFWYPHNKFEIGTRAQWKKTATHYMPLPPAPSGTPTEPRKGE